MTKEEIVKYIQENYGITYDNPFSDIEAMIFRHKDNRKWFAILMQVKEEKIKGAGKNNIDILDVKIDPLIREPILKKKGVYVAYHMNKVHWITIDIANIEKSDFEFLLDLSYNLTKKQRLLKI